MPLGTMSLSSVCRSERASSQEVDPPGHWFKVRWVDAAPMNAFVPSTTGRVGTVTEMVELIPFWDYTDEHLVGDSMGVPFPNYSIAATSTRGFGDISGPHPTLRHRVDFNMSPDELCVGRFSESLWVAGSFPCVVMGFAQIPTDSGTFTVDEFAYTHPNSLPVVTTIGVSRSAFQQSLPHGE